MTLKISKAFSKTPGPRHRDEGDHSGQEFREDCLWPAVQKAIAANEKLVVDFDGTAGYGTSFLEEAFGGLIRSKQISLKDALDLLDFISKEEEYLPDDVREYMRDADAKG